MNGSTHFSGHVEIITLINSSMKGLLTFVEHMVNASIVHLFSFVVLAGHVKTLVERF